METTLYLQFKKTAEHYSQMLCLSEDDYHLTYKRADKLVDDISYSLHSQGVQAGDVVALYTAKSLDGVLVFLALSRLGATCLTLDLAFPPAMIEHVLEDANVRFVVSQKMFPANTSVPVLSLPKLIKAAEGEAPIVLEDHIAWLVYSSGTTGKPKGICISGHAMLTSIQARHQFCSYSPEEKVACNIYFYWEAFRPLFFGAHVVVVSDELLFNVDRYIDFLHTNEIIETLWTPSFAEMLLANLSSSQLEALSSLKRIWFNGEVVSDKLAKDVVKLLPHTKCYNLYSISETFDVSAKLIQPQNNSDASCASIGFPLPSVQAWILDKDGRQCDVGETGELFLHSRSLADGYLNNAKAQAEAFVHISSLYTFARCYRTKDLAYRDEHGEIFVLGRNDYVVKLRGYNVSLLAIEDTLKKSLAIRHCAVKLEGGQAVSQVLVAALEPNDYQQFINHYEIDLELGLSKKLQTYLSEVLPSYAVPTRFVIKQSLALDPYSSKLDRKKVFNNYSDDKLLAIWQDIFHCDEKQLTDASHFFEMGANSLQSIELMHRVKKLFNFTFTIEQLHQYPTIGMQRQFLNNPDNQHQKQKIDYANDLSIDLTLKPIANKLQNLSEAKHVFITGVTGFLGAHWLSECLQTTKAQYHCLVRATDKAQALQRIKQAFEHYQLDSTLIDERVTVVAGCLTQAYLGLNPKEWQTLTQQMEIILHAASQVNLFYPYQQLKASIVDGTRRMLTLATTEILKPMIVISSDSVYPKNYQGEVDAFLSDKTFNALTYGYAQAKWVQEALVKKVSQTYDLPYLVVRLGNLAPSLQTGIVNANDVNHLVCQAIHQTHSMPENLALEFTPVDKVVGLLITMNINNKVLQLGNTTLISASRLQALCESWHLKIVSLQDWQQLLQESAPELLAIEDANGLGLNIMPPVAIAKQLQLSKTEQQQLIHYLANAKLQTLREA